MKNTETVDFCRDAVHRAIKLGKKISPPEWLIILFFVISLSPGVDIISILLL